MTKFTAVIALRLPIAPLATAIASFDPDSGVDATSGPLPEAATLAPGVQGDEVIGADAVDPIHVEASVDVTVSATPRVTVIGADAGDRTRLDEALARFRDNGLDLPDLDLRFYGDDLECGGHEGLFQQSHLPWRILICSDLEFVPTHEVAHAWEAATLSDDDRDRYVEARGLATWDEPDASWNDRGVEEVAFIIQQNLMTEHPSLDSPTWIERIDAYELATGLRSPLPERG